MRQPTIEIRRIDVDDWWHWALVGGNGLDICQSIKGFPTKFAAKRAAKRAQQLAARAVVPRG